MSNGHRVCAGLSPIRPLPFAIPFAISSSTFAIILPDTLFTVTVPRSFDMTRSPFGRLVLGSRRGTFQGGYVYALWVAGLASGLLIADQVIWTVLQEEITARPAGRVATLFWTGQVLALCLVVALCGIGFRPRIDVAVDGLYLRVASNKRTLDVPLSEIRSVIRVPADEYHRTYRRSSAVRHFVNRLHSEVVVFETPDHTVALGLSDADTDLIVGVLSA